MGQNSCSNAPQLMWDDTIYVGDSQTQSVVGKVNGQVVQIICNEPMFDRLTCITDDALIRLKKAEDERLNQCEKWKQ